jgi:hypothetical protein
MKAGRYWEAQQLAARSLEVDPRDEDFLYRGGVIAAILRRKEAPAMLQQYLERSNSLHGDPKAREKAQRALALLRTPRAAPSEAGKPNWFSGNVLQPGIFYCPISLTFQPRIESISAQDGGQVRMGTGRQTAESRHQLRGCESRAGLRGARRKDRRSCRTRNSVFRLSDRIPAGVSRGGKASPPRLPKPFARAVPRFEGELTFNGEGVRTGGQYRLALSGSVEPPDVRSRCSPFLGGPVATGVAGNSYFNPFVWDSLHVFRFQYDKLGRVESARKLAFPAWFRFEWRNDQLGRFDCYDVSDAPKRSGRFIGVL